MTEIQKTLAFAGSAAVLVVLALVATPRRPEAAPLMEEGKPFYPAFTDPKAAASLEVIEYNEKEARPKQFKVQLAGGKWTIPSHYNYPADGQERLAKVAASMIDVKKESLRSERALDHKELGVLDPMDPNAGPTGRGRRVTLKDASGSVLADFIFGKPTREGSEARYVRVPDQNKTYAVKTKIEISTKFEDWIETDLLKATSSSIRKVTIDNYSVTPQGEISNRATYFLSRDDSGAAWKVSGAKENEEANTENINTMTSAISDLKIMGVRPKPSFLVKDLRATGDIKIPDLRRLTPQQRAKLSALVDSGYYPGQLGEEVQLVSNEGELQVSCEDGIAYTLRFGNLIVGEGEELSAGSEEPKKEDPKGKKEEKKGGTEGRYLFVTVRFDESLLAPLPTEPVPPTGYKPEEKKEAKKEERKDGEKKDGDKKDADKKDAKPQESPEVQKYKKDKEEWDKKKSDREKKVADGKKRAQELTDRFAEWYYVISAETFKKLRKEHKDLVKTKEPPKDEKKPVDKKPDEKKDEKKPEEKKDQKTTDKPKKPEEKKEDKKPQEKKEEKKPLEKKPEEKTPGEKKP